LEDAYEEGKAKSIGVSNFQPNHFIDLAFKNKVVKIARQIKILAGQHC
jgi:2,5-diketo-D-gluconate reductase A